MKGSNDRVQGFPLSAYCYISLRLPLAYASQPKYLLPVKVIMTSIPVNRMGRQLKAEVLTA
jgi:hypothetical protein